MHKWLSAPLKKGWIPNIKRRFRRINKRGINAASTEPRIEILHHDHARSRHIKSRLYDGEIQTRQFRMSTGDKGIFNLNDSNEALRKERHNNIGLAIAEAQGILKFKPLPMNRGGKGTGQLALK